ncbi:6-phospho-3-hexuloisomerase [Mammaliicoccus sciuri]|uniref:6-phospho-3-hexuloisomerase n=1 Tax=Mammaliicoccus sciuri TaxID=1296 RepID=UPI001A99DFCF|nr:6-phospho-3-hexuloisomerase [Mammaliicoccus sciuri]MBO1207551.1 6-phospho-3-hexuloisomerase [Mammaliicoccus sciuri]
MSRYQLILNELTQTLNQVDLKDTEQFVNSLQSEVPVFVAAKGRSAFIANSFAMRLNQLGKKSYVVGETSTPSINEGDKLLIVSGSGSTAHLKLLAQTAKDIGANIILISTKEQSPIAEIADDVIVLPASTKYDEKGSEQPLGSLFEQSTQLYLDSIVMDLMEQLNVSETFMQNKHANLE